MKSGAGHTISGQDLEIQDGDDRNTRFTDAGLSSILEGCRYLELLKISNSVHLFLYGRRWANGPVRFAELLARKAPQLKWVTVHGCSLHCLALLRKSLPLTIFDHDGDTSATNFEYKESDARCFRVTFRHTLFLSLLNLTMLSIPIQNNLMDSGPVVLPKAKAKAKAKTQVKVAAKTRARARAGRGAR